MRWITRSHWLWGLVLPGRWFLLLVLLGLAGSLTGTCSIKTGSCMLAVAVLGLSSSWLQWRSFSLSVTLRDRVLWERRGLLVTSERCIQLGLAGSLQFSQSPLGRLLDYGTLSIVAIGGPYEWQNIGRFASLRQIIESNRQWTFQQTALPGAAFQNNTIR